MLLWLYIYMYCKTEMPYTDIISFSKCQMYTALMFLNSWLVDSYAFLKTESQCMKYNKAKKEHVNSVKCY